MLREVVEGRPRASEVPAQRISEIKLKKGKRYCREETADHNICMDKSERTKMVRDAARKFLNHEDIFG